MFCSWVKIRTQLGYLVEEMSKQSVEGVAWLLFTAYSKFQEERDQLKKKWLKIKEPELDGLGVSWLMLIAKIRKFTVEKAHSGESTKGVAGQYFAEEI